MFALIALLLGPFDVMTLPKAHIGSRIEVVELAPVFHQPFVCGEHPEGSLHYVGDALGRDCVIIGGLDPVTSEGFPKPFGGDGRRVSGRRSPERGLVRLPRRCSCAFRRGG